MPILLIICLSIVIIISSCVILPSYTPNIKGEKAISSLEKIELGGVSQSVLIRGNDTSNPIILFLHGGPGMPMMYLAHEFQRPLEEHFIVVHWDQRGAGKSYYPEMDPKGLTLSQYLSDSQELIEHLLLRFGKENVNLVCHSWGTYLGSILIQEHPKLFSAYVGVGQVINSSTARALQREYLLSEAEKRHDLNARKEIEDNSDYVLEKWLFKYGGELRASKSWTPLLLSGLRSPEYSLADALKVPRGSSFSSSNIQYDVYDDKPIDTLFQSYEVPMYYFQGRHDWTTPSILVTEYYESISAPHKGLYWFDNSAHFPFFEEPQIFCERLIAVLR